MPVIKIWCLPKSGEEELKQLHKGLVATAVNIAELGLKDENDMTMLFPPDMMKYGLGSEIIIEVTGLFEKPGRSDAVRNRLAAALGNVVKTHFPEAKVECFVYPFPARNGFWTSRDSATLDEVRAIQRAIAWFLPRAKTSASQTCYCQANNADNRGPCHHHNSLAIYNDFAKRACVLIEASGDSQAEIDVFVTDAKQTLSRSRYPEFAEMMNWHE